MKKIHKTLLILLLIFKYYISNYSPAAIIRNAKIWNIILLVAFFPNVKLKNGLRISCSVRGKLFEVFTTTALTPNLLGISAFLGFVKRGGT